MRVAVVDIGTNSTRLLIADVGDGTVTELDRRSIVTRLGEGVEATGELGAAPRQRVLAALDQYARAIADHGCDARTAVLTSAVRDAANGPEFTAEVRERYGLHGRTLSGDEEARMTFLGATATHDPGAGGELLVIDVGGGSTELVVGHRDRVDFHVSTQAGVVRHSERHIRTDPPRLEELAALATDARAVIEAGAPPEIRDDVRAAVAVGGTATSCAAIDLELDTYDATRVEGHVLTIATLERELDGLAALPLDERRRVTGLHPDRAPTIVAGVLILTEALRAFGLDATEISERDILWGAALETARAS